MNRLSGGVTGAELADSLWLATRLDPETVLAARPGTPPPAPQAGIEEPLAEVLDPFRQLVPARERHEFDEQATARQLAAGVRWPAARRVPRAGWDVVVVVDDHVSMSVWAGHIRRFVGLLRRHTAFHDVRLCRLVTTTTDPAAVMLRGRGSGLVAATRRTSLPAVGRRRIVLVLTDGAAPAWQVDAVAPHLHEWARRQPVALVHLLPQQMWHRTGVYPLRMRLRSALAAAPNARLDWQYREAPASWPPDRATPAGQIPVPVVELRSRWLRAWTELLAGHPPRWIEMPALLVADHPVAPPPAPAGPEPDAAARVGEFVSHASPQAQRLATHLAAAPLERAVIRLVQDALLPRSTTLDLSEVLTSPLVRASRDDRGRPEYEFGPGVRAELLATGRRADTVRVWRLLAERLGANRPALAEWGRILDDPTRPLPPVTTETAPLVRVERAVLRALSGRYLARARQLDAALDALPAPRRPSRPESPAHGTPPTPSPSGMMTVGTAANADRSVGIEGAGLSSSMPEDATAPARIPAVWGDIPLRNAHFTGRRELLADLHQQVRGGTTALLPHALHGMGGVGKSQLAVEYVHRHRGDYDLIWWIPAERSTQINASFVELAARLNLTTAEADIGSARAAVHEALRLGRPYPRWLLIFDNAESPESLRPFLPSGGSGDIIITSRNPQWATVARTLEVDVFSRAESVELLRRRGPELSDAEADRLAEQLGDLPLALEQAAAWRAATGMPAEEYLRLFDQKRIDLLEQAPPMDYQLPVAAAWNVSLDRLESSNPAAFRLLQLCSFLAPDPIPRTLFQGAQNDDIHPDLNVALRDPMRLSKATRDIGRYALARVSHRTNSLQMHRLIQAVLIDRMSEQERVTIRRSAHLLLASADRNDPDSPQNWQSYAELYPHVMASDAVHSDNPWVQQLILNEAKYLYWWGDFSTSLDLSRQAYDVWRVTLGEDASMTLAIGHWLGFMLYRLGRHREAAQLNARIRDLHERRGEDDNEDLLRAIGAVAADLRAAGEFQQALEMDEDLYRRHLRALGEDEPTTLNAAHNLAVSLRLTGDIRRAYEVDEKTHRHRVLLFGEDHAHTLESHLNLIIDRRELGEYLPARAEMQNVVDRLPQVWGSAQTQVLTARRRLASAVRKAGDHRAALELSREVRDGFASRFGPQHPDTLLASFGLAVDLRATGDYDTAARLTADIVTLYTELFDEEHPYTVAARLSGAIVDRLRGDAEQARVTNEVGIEVLTRRLGADHPLTLAALINLGNDLYDLGRHEEAYERDRTTADRCAAVFGDEHPTTLICLGNLAMDLMALGRDEEAQVLHDRITPTITALLGERHPATIAGTDLTIRGDCDLDPMPL
ncbi:Tetratricopeptide repeat-containing protein [Micromonospora nigra]|uniref:Tetratricopeptide repeat-containing protein n=1 Tax=Micromonospora nigra TaxID=145857 RepID=A0A1C6SGU5_9ACTN|nr:FxSxx-COOH system tetratricopeptide repeat protein [Micromonospora nigra]SCL28499.1 Tetratricopeptide repeat-containing protein [Micromonospora nigra]